VGENSKIEWCDHSHNPWYGCTEVSPACDFCYARVMMDERLHRVQWGAGNDRVQTTLKNRLQPLFWNAKANRAGRIETVFCLSLGDVWDNEVPQHWRSDLFATIEATPNLLWLLLSKRIGNARAMCNTAAGARPLPPNAALGATMVNQEEWDRDYLKLKQAGTALDARFTFVSVEPMLGPITLRDDRPDWVICGGESGPNARTMELDWARSLRDQCGERGIAFFMKQLTKKAPIPEDLMVRQFPR
jgi:protein gp37